MYEWITSFSSFLNSDASSMNTDNVYYHAVAFVTVILGARIANRKTGGLFIWCSRKLPFRNTKAASQRAALAALKACPTCTEQLPLSALVCERCEYNFLSGAAGHRHKLLPAPDAAIANH
jgi:hypothetical protein